MPEVTVLLAVQAGDDPAATVQDLCGQTLEDIEILVLARAGAVALEDGDRRVRVVTVEAAEGEFLGNALTQGLAVAQGAMVARAVPGDVSLFERLSRQAKLLRAATTVAFVATGWRQIGLDGSVSRVVTPPAGDAALRAAMTAGDAIGHPTALIWREAVVAAGGWRPAFVDREDYDLLLRLMDRSAGACTPEPMVDHVTAEAVPSFRVIEQRIVSEMAAITAFDRRQAGRPDHGDRALPADRALLHRMGVVDEEITQTIVARALALALNAGAYGQWRTMREAARLGLQQAGLPTAAKSRFAKLWMQSVARRRPSGWGDAAPTD